MSWNSTFPPPLPPIFACLSSFLLVQDNFSQIAPKPPDFFNKIRLPEMDYVEVYNQPPREENLRDNGSSDPSLDAVRNVGGIVCPRSLTIMRFTGWCHSVPWLLVPGFSVVIFSRPVFCVSMPVVHVNKCESSVAVLSLCVIVFVNVSVRWREARRIPTPSRRRRTCDCGCWKRYVSRRYCSLSAFASSDS